MQDFVAAVGLVLVIEGLVYGVFPSAAKRMAAEAMKAREGALRMMGVISIALGVGVVWLVRG